MKKQRRIVLVVCLSVLTVAGLFSPTAAKTEEKLRSEDVVARHLASVGTPQARDAIKTVYALGTVVATFREPSVGQVAGRVILASEGERNLIGMAFDNTSYPQERVGFDGKDVSVSYVRPGQRTALGEFLLTHKSIVRQGVLGGALSLAWPLLDPEVKKAKLEYSGTKKIGDSTAHVLKYLPRGGSDLNVSLFFDAETFRHLRTEYTRTVSAQMGVSPNASARQRESRYKMVEEFSDFRRKAGLTLPYKYKMTLEATLPGGSYKAEWDTTFSQFGFNQSLDPASFDVDGE